MRIAIRTLTIVIIAIAASLAAPCQRVSATVVRQTVTHSIRTQSNPPWTQTILYEFNAYANGWSPSSGVIADAHGALYGVTNDGGLGSGVVYQLAPTSSGWTYRVLHTFAGGNDGQAPSGNLVIDAAGNLYGTTPYGGSTGGGIVFELSPSSAGWTYKILHTFVGGSDGFTPNAPLLRLDSSGTLYGTTMGGGQQECTGNSDGGCGIVFKLTPTASGWNNSAIYTFNPVSGDGFIPQAGLTSDGLGNLYGVTYYGGVGGVGTVFRLLPPYAGRKSWSESLLHQFTGYHSGGDGAYPGTTLVWRGGSLFGTTKGGGLIGTNEGCPTFGGCGTVFQLDRWSGTWEETQIFAFSGDSAQIPYPGPLFADNSGNVFCPYTGTLARFYWTANGSGGSWIQSQVYPYFSGGGHGGPPLGLIQDAQGNLYGASDGGAYKHGVIYRLNI